MSSPKLFISYCWSNAEHEQWVMNLASDLLESGVDTILDKWDLREGHDALAFMEKMVTDPAIEKVVIVSDAMYVEKADGRLGGVGTETQIISKKIYDSQNQNKFVAVVAQRDENGKAYLPTYYSSRIYIDLSDDEKRISEFEKLLRWIYNKPLHVKPEIGKVPAFLEGEQRISLGTSAQAKRCIDAIKNHRAHASGSLDEYLDQFVGNLERFRIKEFVNPIDELIVKSIEDLLPYRNEFSSIVVSIAQYSSSDKYAGQLHNFFEKLMLYMCVVPKNGVGRDELLDNFKFFVHELFLYALAILLKYERFDEANILISQKYYVPSVMRSYDDPMVSYLGFREYAPSFDQRNSRLKLNRMSVRADLLHDRSAGSGIDFVQVMQADFLAYIRAEILSSTGYGGWWPETLIYSFNIRGAFELFARSSSKLYFNRIKFLLGVDGVDEVKAALDRIDTARMSQQPLGRSSVHDLIGIKNMCRDF